MRRKLKGLIVGALAAGTLGTGAVAATAAAGSQAAVRDPDQAVVQVQDQERTQLRERLRTMDPENCPCGEEGAGTQERTRAGDHLRLRDGSRMAGEARAGTSS